MLSDEALLLSAQQLAKSGQRAPVLLLLSQLGQPVPTVKIREKGVTIGFRIVSQWNVTAILKAAAKDGQVAQLAEGWKLLGPGYKIVEGHYRPEAAIILETRHSLRTHLMKIDDDQRKAFVEEALKSFDVRAYRSAVVLSWVCSTCTRSIERSSHSAASLAVRLRFGFRAFASTGARNCPV